MTAIVHLFKRSRVLFLNFLRKPDEYGEYLHSGYPNNSIKSFLGVSQLKKIYDLL